MPSPPEPEGKSTRTALADWGIQASEINRLAEAGVLGRSLKEPA
jgi:hypothetical protein